MVFKAVLMVVTNTCRRLGFSPASPGPLAEAIGEVSREGGK